MNGMVEKSLSKVPEVTLIFWVIKIAAMTPGNTSQQIIFPGAFSLAA